MGKTRIGQWQVLKGMDRNQVGLLRTTPGRKPSINHTTFSFLNPKSKYLQILLGFKIYNLDF